MRSSSSSLEAGPTPSKNAPTSHFQRSRYGRRIAGLSSSGSSSALKVLSPSPHEQATLAARPQVAHPLRVTARRDEVLGAADGQEIDRRAPPLTGLAAAHLEHARPGDAHPGPRQQGDGRVEDVLGEPAGALIAVGHWHRLSQRRRHDPRADVDRHALRDIRIVDPPEREAGEAVRERFGRGLDLLGRDAPVGVAPR